MVRWRRNRDVVIIWAVSEVLVIVEGAKLEEEENEAKLGEEEGDWNGTKGDDKDLDIGGDWKAKGEMALEDGEESGGLDIVGVGFDGGEIPDFFMDILWSKDLSDDPGDWKGSGDIVLRTSSSRDGVAIDGLLFQKISTWSDKITGLIENDVKPRADWTNFRQHGGELENLEASIESETSLTMDSSRWGEHRGRQGVDAAKVEWIWAAIKADK